jgi:hypothetical protein
VNLVMMGIMHGSIYACIMNGDIDQVADKIKMLEARESLEFYAGNSDMI